MIVGCAGFPVGRQKYVKKLGFVEYRRPKGKWPTDKTLTKMRESVPVSFQFSVEAPKSISHPSTKFHQSSRSVNHSQIGYFQCSRVNLAALSNAVNAAQKLGAKMIIFDLPTSWTFNPDHISRMSAFFGPLERNKIQFLWRPPRKWPLSLISQLSQKLALIPIQHPYQKDLYRNGPFFYFEIKSPGYPKDPKGIAISDLEKLKKNCHSNSYVIFDTGPTSFHDAVRFSEIPK